jgi:alkanesulfonate monooxygenase SsuD/methylene tetrahydromethanopterin reductase-like flavin-dependent oxidoreductase (luciferase family)
MRCHFDLSLRASDFDGGAPGWWILGPPEQAAETVAAFASAGVTDLVVTPAPGKSLDERVDALGSFADTCGLTQGV